MPLIVLLTVVLPAALGLAGVRNRTKTTERGPRREAVDYWVGRGIEAAQARNGVRA